MDLSRVSRLELLLTKQLRIIRERDGGVRCVVYGYYPVHTANYSISFRNPIHQFCVPANPQSRYPALPDRYHTHAQRARARPTAHSLFLHRGTGRHPAPPRSSPRAPLPARPASFAPAHHAPSSSPSKGAPSTGAHPRGGRGNGTAAAHFIAPPRMAALRERCEPRKSLSIAVTAIPQQRQGSKLRKSLSATVADPRYACRARPRSRRYPRPPSPS